MVVSLTRRTQGRHPAQDLAVLSRCSATDLGRRRRPHQARRQEPLRGRAQRQQDGGLPPALDLRQTKPQPDLWRVLRVEGLRTLPLGRLGGARTIVTMLETGQCNVSEVDGEADRPHVGTPLSPVTDQSMPGICSRIPEIPARLQTPHTVQGP